MTEQATGQPSAEESPGMSPSHAEATSPDVPADRRSTNTSIAVLLSLVFVLVIFLPLWKPLLLAMILTAAVARWHDTLAGRLGDRRYLSASLFTIAVVGLILAPLLILGTITISQASRGVAWVSETLSGANVARVLDSLPVVVARLLRSLIERLPKSFTEISMGSGEIGSWIAEQLQGLLAVATNVAFEAAMMVIAFFFLLIDGKQLTGWVKTVSPLGRSRTQELFDEFRQVSRSLIGANILTGAAQAAVATTGYVIAGTPSPLFFGTLTFLTSFIPSVGTSIVCLPLSGLLVLVGKPWAGLFLAVWGVALVGVVDNVLRPLLLRGDAGTHGALLFFSIIGGMMLFGLAGLIVGPLALAFFLATMRFHARDLQREGLVPLEAGEKPAPEA